MLLRPLTVPALNKWTKVAPCVGLVTLLQHFCKAIPRAMQEEFQAETRADSGGEEDEGAALGAPINQTRVAEAGAEADVEGCAVHV